MNTQRNITGTGLTGFWMRVGSNLSVKVVNGTMSKLQNGKSACTLIHILSPRFARQMLAEELYRHGKFKPMVADNVWIGRHFGLFGLKVRLNVRGWGSNTKSLRSKAQRERAATLPNTYLNPPFSRLIGLPDGNALDTLKAFQKRRKGKQMP